VRRTLVAGLAAALLAVPAQAALPEDRAPAGWTPGVGAAARWAQERTGAVSFAVRTPAGLWCLRCDVVVDAASVTKVLLLAAYLRRDAVARRPLQARERRRLAAMVRRSDDDAANRVAVVVGTAGPRRVARAAGLASTVPRMPVWGATRTTARDQTQLMLQIDRLLPPRHRAFGMRLLATVVASQRWGVGRVAPPCWQLFFKGGWGAGTGRVEHQVALLRRGAERFSLVVMTTGNRGKRDGERTLEGVAGRLLSRLPAPAGC